jgi:predicted Zn-dependent protease
MDSLREAIEAEFVTEREGWAFERVSRVTAKLQEAVPEAERLETIVVWDATHNAFTAPGKTIYFGRRLLERLVDDDAAAFVIAHEIAHHRLGHIPALTNVMLRLPLRLLLAMLEKWIAMPQREADADLLAIEMCLDAGYDVEKCVAALEHLSFVALDYGDIDGALGAEDPKDDAKRTHPPVRHRIVNVRVHAGRVKRYGYRLAVDLDERKRTRKRRIAIAAGAAGAAVALFLIRRR